MSSSDLIETFISRWGHSGAAERANYQMFLSELCDLLDVPRPNPTSPDPEKNLYVFDRAITRVNPDGSSVTNYIDLYHARHFVCETKQGVSDSPAETTTPKKSGHGLRGSSAFDKALERAYHQGRDYITHLPAAHGRPPFLIVCDVGHSIDLYAEFTCTGGRYERFPDPKHHRILLADLRQEEIRERLRLVFTDPHALDPSKRAAEVTRDIANRLAHLSRSLEKDGHHPEIIAGFLQRCLFTMFAEDIGLLPDDGFKNLIAKTLENPQGFPVLVSGLWKEMATGTSYSSLLFQEIAYFNGGLFDTTTALPLQKEQIHMLHEAAMTDWSGVEPSIFGTLLTRALDSRERHKLGAEYTPRSYVERLIRPTIIDPLREQWESTRLAAATLHNEAEVLLDSADVTEDSAKQSLASGNAAAAKEQGAAAQKLRADAKRKDAEALKLVTDFHRHLCALKILDPACGTANFLYVTLEHMKRLEAEVLELVTALGGDATFEMNEYKVRPEQFLGLELSPNAVAIAQLVLWIGYFQWQRKTTGKADTGDRPLLPKTQSIRQQDAVLAYDDRVPRTDPDTGKILTIWDGHTTKPHPVTGKEVPDESATIALFDYINPRRAEWPQADYIVGNPP
ncbi:MAG: class I SAM-dependent DNA methyltransferase, partial [Verrucomicrobia bacterium]